MIRFRSRHSVHSLVLFILGVTFAACESGPTSPGAARFALSATSLVFSPADETRPVTITNLGNDPIDWSIQSTSASWLVASPMIGNLAPRSSGIITVEVNRGAVSQGSHSAALQVRAGGDLLTLNVAVEQGSSPQATLEPSALTLGPLDDSSVLEISNPGGSTLDWTLASAAAWASVNPASGRLVPGSVAQIVVSVHRSGLARGTYIAPLYLTSSGGSGTATLTMVVGEGAGLHLDPPSIDFGLSSSQLPVRIVNDGYTALNWSAEPGASWISLSSRSGQIPARSNGFVTVTASRSGMTYGPHQAAVRFTSNGGSAALTVKVTASPPGPTPSPSPSEIDVTPASLDFGGTTSEMQLLVSNGGNDPLDWTGHSDANWATLSPNSGRVSGHSSTPVVVQASRAGLTAGTYQTTVRFLSSGGTKTVTLLMVVPSGGPAPNPEPEPEPEPDIGQIHVTPRSLDFGEAATKLNLQIQNTGASTVSYSAQSSKSWLTIGSTSGTILPGVTRVIEVTASRAGLSAAGSYQASIQLTSNGGNVTVPVSLQVPPPSSPPPSPPPAQIYVTSSLDFGATKTELYLVIQNTGASTVSYSAQTSTSWLTLGPASGTIAPTVAVVIVVTASRAGLSVGSHQGSIQVVLNGSNRAVPVSLLVPPPPAPTPPGGWNLGNIDATGKLDVTDHLNAYLASVPDGSVIQFPAGARYRAEGVVRLIDKNDIVIEGNGATIFATTDGGGAIPPEDLKHLWPRLRSHVRLDRGRNIHIKNLRVVGAHPNAGLDDTAYVEPLEAQHAFWIAGSVGVELEGVYASDVYGDFVYISSGGQWANDIHVHHSFFERNGRQGVAITGGQNILIEANTFNDIRRSSIDLEPSTAAGGAVNVTIRGNTFGARRLTFIASLGRGPNVRNIVVEDNTLASPMIIIVGIETDRRGPFIIRNNRSTAGFGSDQPLMRFENIDGVQVVGNYHILNATRSRTLVGVRNSTNVDVHDNEFPGGLYEVAPY